MKRTRLTTAAGAALALCAALCAATQPAQAAAEVPGFRVSDGRLLDANGDDFVLRGVNHAHTWYPDRTDQALKDIKAQGANSVRVVLSTGAQWTKNDTADVARVVGECKRSRLICVLEAHDTTGYGEQGSAVSLAKAVEYWLSVQDGVKGQEKYVIVNIGNEPYGNTGYGGWTGDTKSAITKMRAAGIANTLMVDAPNWGQDWSFTMRDNAAGVFAADPDKNTVFSIHMYGVFDTKEEISDYLGRFTSAKLPIVVGEFGDMHSDGNPDEAAIMATARSLGVGYMGWSWSGNGGGVEYLDLVSDFDGGRLTPWGERLFNGPDGIKETAEEAGVFSKARGEKHREPRN
ncbi:glycoside hydrolase family 5 protein [Streptomyces sp. NPDC047525]|uniref:glycoside hydrolase family 5 protein n=1 Tax=Streptomyces sp. NPDC047525 TaxID=3155264 RepID=UPI0033F6D5A4